MLTGESDLDFKQVKEMCSTVYWMKQSHIPFKFDFTQKDFSFCEAIVDYKLYVEGALGNEHSWEIQTLEKFQLLKAFATKTDQTILKKYQQKQTQEKHLFYLFSGHQENLFALQRSFGLSAYTRVSPASAFFFVFDSQQNV